MYMYCLPVCDVAAWNKTFLEFCKKKNTMTNLVGYKTYSDEKQTESSNIQ